ncbi:MAG: 16S rRNA (cytidine(1402)-2'-O)-methyltransferase [Rhodospirillales bacterium]
MTKPGKPPVLIRCDGHPNIKASHGRTLELTEDADVTTRGTCIIGVNARFDEAELAGLRGRLSVTLRVGDLEDRLEAFAAPGFTPGQPLIFRRAMGGVTRTFAQGATKGASDLERGLVAALREPGAELVVEITEQEATAGEGALFLVGMPIGAMQDLSPRAAETLAAVDCVFAEDSRTIKETLNWLGLSKPVISCHDHNEAERLDDLSRRLGLGERLAYVSEAGMPVISDPGYQLVRRAVDDGALVTAVPGPSAVATAVALSGLASDSFAFFGFPPRGSSKRRPWLAERLDLGPAAVFYESCHRIRETLADLAAFESNRELVLACDLTKQTEWLARGAVSDVLENLPERAGERGEYTLVVAGAGFREGTGAETEGAALAIEPLMKSLLADGVPTKAIARAIAAATGMSRRDAFQAVLALKDGGA